MVRSREKKGKANDTNPSPTEQLPSITINLDPPKKSFQEEFQPNIDVEKLNKTVYEELALKWGSVQGAMYENLHLRKQVPGS
jgi:hypothetical protein